MTFGQLLGLSIQRLAVKYSYYHFGSKGMIPKSCEAMLVGNQWKSLGSKHCEMASRTSLEGAPIRWKMSAG